MNSLEVQAVKRLERIIEEVKEGKFNIDSVGTRNIIEETNIMTGSGPVEKRVLVFEIEHTVYPNE